MSYEEVVVNSLTQNNVQFMVHIPDKVLLPIVKLAEHSGNFTSLLVAREEEGVAICAGLHMGGKKPVILMQSSGIGNSVTALTSVIQSHQIPLVIIVSLRGGLFEYNPSDVPLGRSLGKLLDSLSIPNFQPGSDRELSITLDGAFRLAETSQGPVVVTINANILKRWENEIK
ncbi:MAG: thiamine pyrophosphate-binding protein [Thermoplasmatales archaeon]|nr:thiamine pyrophosphate-binding protein [Thermoplasmatales archaeon]